MPEFSRNKLSNGLNIIVCRDLSTPMAALDICYHVGSKNEDFEHTGFSHLFEHLMFGGSKNIPDFDLPLQNAGGENNAYTTNDLTNYYLTLPSANLEIGFWLESDRMLELAFSQEGLEIQQNVVIEEFKQRTLNRPYGDVWPLVRELAYEIHPYRWPVIGRDINHIKNATIDEVKSFFYRYYAPDNATLIVSGNVDEDNVLTLAEKWFAPLPCRNVVRMPVPQEPEQTSFKLKIVERNVPDTMIYMAFHMGERHSREYYICDMISDILAGGNSSRLYCKLVKEKQLFVEVDAYISGDNDPGLFVVAGKLSKSLTIENAALLIWEELSRLKEEFVDDIEIDKIKNKLEADRVFSQMNYLNVAQELASFESLGDAGLINEQSSIYQSIMAEDIRSVAQHIFRMENCSQLNYIASK